MIMNVNKMNIIATGMLLVVLTAITSCSYQKIGEADFPEGIIYLPAAANGNYLINRIPAANSDYRFQVNAVANEFIIPLSVYRSGLNISSSFTVDVKADSDRVVALLTKGAFGESTIGILPQDKYELTSLVEMNGGDRKAPFTLKIDLDYLLSNEAVNDIYVLGVNISSADCESNKTLSTAIIMIYPEILHPVADFSYRAGTEEKQIRFTNASDYQVSSQWDFGDGNSSTETSPSHVYDAVGTYSVKLTVTGVSGEISEKTIQVIVQ